jgi:hypothetical protein
MSDFVSPTKLAAPAESTNTALRERSGSVNSSDPLVSFLYILMRDHIPAGVVEGIMQHHVDAPEGTLSELCNGYLASYAKDVAARLHGDLA